MRLASPWTARLSAIDASPSQRLVAALADDIAQGLLNPGARLPAHRDLAYRLGIGLGTVTKAYALLERRGLVQSVRGRGTFVADLSQRPGGMIDLSINTPPHMLSDRLLSATLAGLARRLDAASFGAYAPAQAREEHRILMSRWLFGKGTCVAPDRLLLCHGAQHALSIAFASLCRGGGLILTEAVTYPGTILLARQAGYPMLGLAMDEEGITPAALDAALRASAGFDGPRVLCVTPTVQNPTAATMGLRRREEIVRLCAAHDIMIVEDDVYAIFAPAGLPRLTDLAPQRTLYVSGLSKTLSPGIRIGALVVPPDLVETAIAKLQASCSMASPLSCLIMEQWLGDGTARSVATSIRSEAAARHALARSLLGARIAPASSAGFHVWLPMARDRARSIALRAEAAGVRLLAPDAPIVDPHAVDGGIRISLGGPSRDRLNRALETLADLLDDSATGSDDRPAPI